jgi:integral membrane protein (TIGR01906 family)
MLNESTLVSGTPATLLRVALAAVWVLALPLFLVSTNLRWVTLDLTTYTSGFARYRATERTGIAPAELERVGREFIEFFKGNRTELQITVQMPGGARPLFNQREVDHMTDVRSLMRLFFRAQPIAGIFLLATIGGAFLVYRRDWLGSVQTTMLAGVISTLVVGGLIGGLSMLDFESLFIKFHTMSFSNDLWQLDPRSDYLLILFPEGFWLDTTLRLTWMTVIEIVALGALALGLPRMLAR